MNGYAMTSQAYKRYLEEHPDEPDNIKESIYHKIKALDLLAECTEEERLELFNSSAFNDVVKGYVKMAANNIGLDDGTKGWLLSELRFLFSTVTADEAEAYYQKS